MRTTAGFDSNIWFRIVGVVEDVRHVALSGDAVPEMYHPIEQTAVPTFTVVMRTAGDPGAATPAARAAVRAVDPDLPIYAALGSAGALAAGPLVRGLLFDTRTTDPFTHEAVVAGAIALAIGASIAPAVHAMRIDPIVALRAD